MDNSKRGELEKRGAKRIVSFDAMRGGAVFGMIFVHTIMRIYDYDWIAKNPEIIADLPLFLIVLIGILGYLGMWISFFIFLSASVNSYTMTMRAKKSNVVKDQLLKQLLSGFLILFISYIREAFIGYKGYIGRLIRPGTSPDPAVIWESLYLMRPLSVIGWCIIINGLIHALLIRNKGYEKYKRNVAVYIILFLSVVVSTPFLFEWGKQIISSSPTFSIRFLLASFLTGANPGDLDPLFPYLATSFVGSIIGLSLARDNPPKRLPLIGAIAALILAITGVLLIVFNVAVHFPDSIFSKPPEVPMYLLFLAGQLALVMLLLGTVEFKGKMEKFANHFIIKKFRLWSMVSLSLFVVDLYELVPRTILTVVLHYFLHFNFLVDPLFTGINGFWWAFLVAFFVLIWYDFTINLWKQINFAGSFEWFLLKIQELLTKTKSSKLNVDSMFNETIFVGFTTLNQQKKVEVVTQPEN